MLLAIILGGVVAKAMAGSGGGSVGGANANERACADFRTMGVDAQDGDYSDDAQAASNMISDNSAVTNARPHSTISTLETFWTEQDSADASSASYVIGGICSGLGYSP